MEEVAEAGVDSGGLAGYVAPSLRHGVDQPLLAQRCDSAPCCGARDLERLYQFALGRDARVGRVLAGLDAPPQDAGYLPVGRKRGKAVYAILTREA